MDSRIMEMMFGGGESFEYVLCSGCGCLQIADIPDDMAPYYSGTYYSHQTSSGIRGYLEHLRDRYSLTGKGLIGKLMNSVFPNQAMLSLRSLKLDQSARILDVGCGSGLLIRALRDCGYSNLTGADPFSDPVKEDGLQILNRSIDKLSGTFDLIMFHHSFEHVDTPAETLAEAGRLLDDGGCCIIRIPVIPCQSWERYGVNWVQLDAPRHFYIHSVDSIKRLAEAAGFGIKDVVYDSTAFQFWGSEQYKKGITLQDEKSFFVNPLKSDTSMLKILKYAKLSRELNASGRGDQAIFYLQKTNEVTVS